MASLSMASVLQLARQFWAFSFNKTRTNPNPNLVTKMSLLVQIFVEKTHVEILEAATGVGLAGEDGGGERGDEVGGLPSRPSWNR